MRTAITAIALAGLTSVAIAQNVGTVSLTASDATVNVGDVFTIGVVLTDNISGNSIFVFNVDVSGSGAAFSTVPGSLASDPLVFGFSGAITNNGAHALGGASDIIGPEFDPSLDDLTVFSFQVTATEAGLISFSPSDAGYASFNAIGQVMYGIVAFPGDYDEVVLIGASVNVIPTPSSLIPLALAFPLTARRRS